METRANYALIGAFTIVVSAFLLGFALWAAKYSSDATWHRYRVIFSEAVTGLSVGGVVQYNGIAVGTVEKLTLDPEDPRRVHAILRLGSDTPVKTDTRAKISQGSLTGSPFIQLSGGSPGSPALRPSPEEPMPLIETEPSALQNISDIASKLVTRLDTLLSEENIAHIASTLENVRNTSDVISSQREEIRLLLFNANEISKELRQTVGNTNRMLEKVDRGVIDSLPQTMSQLERTIASLESASRNANALIEDNRAPLNQFSRDGLQQIGPTLEELRALMRDLRQISTQLESNPSGYLLGREQPKEFTP